MLVSEQDMLSKHVQEVLAIATRVFAEELESEEDIAKQLPLVKWDLCNQAPGAFVLYLLNFAPRYCCNPTRLLEEIISYWTSSPEEAQILSSRNTTLKLPHYKRSFFFAELIIHISDEKKLQSIQNQISTFIEEIRLATLSIDHAKHILEMKRISLSSKTSFLHEMVLALIRRYPKRFGHDIFREVQHFLVHCREGFRQIRHARHLCRIICTHYLFQKDLEQDIKAFPQKRHLYLKLSQTQLYYPFGLNKVLGITIALNRLGDYESFELRHILKAIQRIFPNVRAHKDSFYSHSSDDDTILTLYLEIEKTNGPNFSIDELKQLSKELPHELKNSIEYLSPSLFIPRNEEELIRNIINLGNELRYVRDLPQAIISFQEQRTDVLKFNVILLRVLTSHSNSLQHLSKKLPNHVRFTPERIANVGILRKKYIKEANVFSLEVENRLFLRKNHSVNLVKARHFVVKVLEKMMGPFRDYNGGFLLKQNEQLEAIKTILGKGEKQSEYLIENLFYSLCPSIIQTYIPPQEGKILFSLFFSTLEENLSNHDACLVRKSYVNHSLALIIKTTHNEIKEHIHEAIKSLNIDSLKLATASLEVEKHTYLCFLYVSSSKAEFNPFTNAIESAITSWEKKRQTLQVLHLHLPRAAQSLDPRIGADRTSGVAIKMLYEGLCRIAEGGEVEPALASEITISEDRKKYIFSLKPTYWSNGSSLTAHDFEYAWKKILEPDFRSPYSFLFFLIKNAEAVKRGEKPMNQLGVHALNDQTLSVQLEYPAPYFLDLTTSWAFSPLCREIDQKHPGWAYHSGETYVCNGPFKLDLWKLNDDLQVVKNPLYWDAKSVKLDRINISIMENERFSLDMFYRGEVDWVGDPLTKLRPTEIPSLKQKKLLHTEEDHYGLFWIQMNLNRLPFQSAKMRKAFAYGTNRKELIQNVLYSEDIPAFGFNYRPQPNSPLNFKDGDEQQALLLFEEGLRELGMQKHELPPIVISHSEIEEQEAISHALGEQWSTLFGIKIKYERLLWNNYFEALNRNDLMIGGIAWYTRFTDPIYFYNLYVFREHAIRVTKWKNATYSRLVEEAAQSVDPNQKEQILQEAEKILLDQMPVIPLLYQKFRYIKNPRLKGYIISNTNQIDFRTAYLQNTQKDAP